MVPPANVIQLSAQRKSVPLIAALGDLCPATVREDLARYDADGLAGLHREASPGPPQKIPLTKADWEEVLHQRPSQFERLGTGARNWTQDLRQGDLQESHQVTVTQPAISKHLTGHGIRCNRGTLKVASPDPLYTVKRERIETLKKSRGGDIDEP